MLAVEHQVRNGVSGAVAALEAQRGRQLADEAGHGVAWANPHGLVFTRAQGDPLSRDEVRDALERALAGAGLPRVTFHTLRQTFVAMMASKGVRIEVVSAMLGHSDIRVALNVYGHLYPEVKRDAARLVDAVFGAG